MNLTKPIFLGLVEDGYFNTTYLKYPYPGSYEQQMIIDKIGRENLRVQDIFYNFPKDSPLSIEHRDRNGSMEDLLGYYEMLKGLSIHTIVQNPCEGLKSEEGKMSFLTAISKLFPDLRQLKLRTPGIVDLSILKSFKKLTALSLSCEIPDDIFENLSLLNSLKYIEIESFKQEGRYNEPHSNMGDFLPYLKNFKLLQELKVYGIKEPSLEGIEIISKLPALRSFTFGFTRAFTWKHFEKIISSPYLESISLNACAVSKEYGSIKTISPNLKSLTIDNPAGYKTLSNQSLGFIKNSNLEELILPFNKLTDSSLSTIATLKNLKILMLFSNPITNKNIKALRYLKNLKKLDLQQTQATSKEIVATLGNEAFFDELIIGTEISVVENGDKVYYQDFFVGKKLRKLV